jgi:myo-inositol 2-dehydrogenase/D-chiro-inositol 1-dehydrogenase
MEKPTILSRREFVRTALGTSVTLSVPTIIGATAKGRGKTFKIGLIGCGGRGRGAAAGSLEAGRILGFNVQIVATAEDFEMGTVKIPKENVVPVPGQA